MHCGCAAGHDPFRVARMSGVDVKRDELIPPDQGLVQRMVRD